MELDVLTAISPIDGRYRGKTKALAAYFSEFALIKYRVQVEVEYFITLCELPLPQLKGIDSNVYETLRNIYRNFSEADAQRIKDIESVTNHDVKAVEYFLKEEFDKMGGMDDYKEFIHFGLTSQDINNTSVPLSIKEALEQVYYPLIEELIAQLKTYATEWVNIVRNLRCIFFAFQSQFFCNKPIAELFPVILRISHVMRIVVSGSTAKLSGKRTCFQHSQLTFETVNKYHHFFTQTGRRSRLTVSWLC